MSRVDLMDESQAVLSVIVETNGASWKLHMTHRLKDGSESRSNWWNFTDRERALAAQEGKVAEAAALGWVQQERLF